MLKEFRYIFENSLKGSVWMWPLLQYFLLPLLPFLYGFIKKILDSYDLNYLPLLQTEWQIVIALISVLLVTVYKLTKRGVSMDTPLFSLCYSDTHEFVKVVQDQDEQLWTSYELGVKNNTPHSILDTKMTLISIKNIKSGITTVINRDLRLINRPHDTNVNLNGRHTEYFYFLGLVQSKKGYVPKDKFYPPPYFRLDGDNTKYYFVGSYIIKIRLSGRDTACIEQEYKVSLNEDQSFKCEACT